MKGAHITFRSRPGSALLITLLMLSLITIIAVASLSTMTWELSSSKNTYENQKAKSFAMLGMATAVGQIRQALDAWDNPYQSFATTPPRFFWSMSPGMITRWSYTSTTPLTNYALFSIDPSGATNLVNLNAPTSEGSYPIGGGATPPNISVFWANVLKNPALGASQDNPIIGRYAFWVDDENAKINLNTADGTMKYQNASLGLGSPSEVSLLALHQGATNISTQVATNIVYLARTTGLNSPKEILRASGTTPDLYTNNNFSITAYNRSPDLNVFGQPKMALEPLLGDTLSTNMVINAITLQPATEIYPTPSQLPTYSVINPMTSPTWYPVNTSNPSPEPWPLAFRGQFGGSVEMNLATYGSAQQDYTQANSYWVNGMMLAKYLAGSNAANQAITWPVVMGASNKGFSGKYSKRQIDSIVAQIVSLGAKEISPDYFYISDLNDPYFFLNADMGYRGRRTTTVPFVPYGWLSNQWVNGMGRTPKVDAMELIFSTAGSMGNTNDIQHYTPPQTFLEVLQEWWLPADYLGGNNVLPVSQPAIYLGNQAYKGVLNAVDLNENLNVYIANGFYVAVKTPSAVPKATAVGSTTGINSYWGNQLLTSNQGMDLAGNTSVIDDPDQGLAAQYHNPFALDSGTPPYHGAGNQSVYSSQLSMTDLQSNSAPIDWPPGEVRCITGALGATAPADMQISADNGTLTIGGGITVNGTAVSVYGSDFDPTPLETIRGNGNVPLENGELWSNPSESPVNSTTPSNQMVRDRVIQSVIPVNFSMPIPGNGNGSTANPVEYVSATVADPLVNKFPGDWIVTYSSNSAPVNPTYWPDPDSEVTATATEYNSGFHTKLGTTINGIQGDPDSYWLPQADCAVSYLADIASQTLIPRSARFPNIGYLQYLRTGIIPDDESLPYLPSSGQPYAQYQHGTPFRLLSYAPSTEASHQQTTRAASQPYPDWAMLDLLYIPSILNPYGGPYGYYDTSSPPVWQGYGNPTVLANFSTGGGSTPGRINPNGAIIYTTNVFAPQPNVSRTLPMEAMLNGLMVNQSLNTANLPSPTPGFSGGTAVDAPAIAQAVYNFLSTNGPIRMPGELCNVPEIAALRPTVNLTRNDLIRQIIGNLTTQSNTFSVWVVGQSIAKSKANSSPGIYQTGDEVSASIRYHFIVERYLDPGADGVYGNAASPGLDGIVGTYDDPVDPINHPYCPRYLYRIVSTEEIR